MKVILYLFLLPLALFAKKVPDSPDLGLPWLTGPLVTPSPQTVPPGKYNIEPYFYAVANTGIYQEDWSVVKDDAIFWANSAQISIQMGILSWLDVQTNPIVYYNYTDGVGSWAFGDLMVGLDFQLYHADDDSWAPNVKLGVKELFPTGKYQKLDPKKKGTDAGGNGSFVSTIGVVCGQAYHINADHYLNVRVGGQYSLPTSVHVQGFNTYGGSATTQGFFYPAQSIQAAIGLEYTVTSHWVLACDGVFNWAVGSDFTGDAETDQELSLSPVGANPLIQYSLAPAIEYNWNGNLGLIIGSWFTVAGKNAIQFYSGIAALNIYY